MELKSLMITLFAERFDKKMKNKNQTIIAKTKKEYKTQNLLSKCSKPLTTFSTQIFEHTHEMRVPLSLPKNGRTIDDCD
jgi:hypothetical protein